MSTETMKYLRLTLTSEANIVIMLYTIGVATMILASILFISQAVTGVRCC